MEKEKKTFKEWVKNHKTELAIAGISATALIALFIGKKNHDTIIETLNELKSVPRKTASLIPESKKQLIQVAVPDVIDNKQSVKRIPHDVCEHIRTLSPGCYASPAKIEEAISKGIRLLPGQTLIDAYRTGNVA